MLDWLFRGRDLTRALNETRWVRIHGVRFRIRRINPLDYMTGGKALRQLFETHKNPLADSVEVKGNQVNAIKSHYSDVFLAAVVHPEIKRDAADGDGIPVGHLLTDWQLATELYAAIQEYTYGKKNLKILRSQSSGA